MSSEIKVITGKETRWNYLHAWVPYSYKGGPAKYSVQLIIPKTDKVTLAKIKVAINTAYDEGAEKLRGGSDAVPARDKISTPLIDGDERYPNNPIYADTYFINAYSSTPPGIVDTEGKNITDRSLVYSGCYGRASISFTAYNNNRIGIHCELNHLQKIADGEHLGEKTVTKADAAADFALADDDDELLPF